MGTETFWTPSGVRLRRRTQRPGPLNWLFLPGGPGIGSESLHELVDSAELPGITWMVDLPGDGSNTGAPGAPADPYALWPHVLLEAADAVPNPVYVGHSTGGMYLLSTPELETRLTGLILAGTAPNASWMPEFVAMTEQNPLPAVAAATEAYEKDRPTHAWPRSRSHQRPGISVPTTSRPAETCSPGCPTTGRPSPGPRKTSTTPTRQPGGRPPCQP